MWVYTQKAEADGVGKAGDEAEPTTYLKIHGYVTLARREKHKTTETGAMATPEKVGKIAKAGRK